MFDIFIVYKNNHNPSTEDLCRPESTPQRSEEVTYLLFPPQILRLYL